jgi:hypothetical protein
MFILQKELHDLISCSHQNWYDNYRKNCIKSYSLQIPANVLNYLKQDFFILPKECHTSSQSAASCSSSSNTKVVGEVTNFDDDTEVDDTEVPEFPDFSNKILEILDKLGGSAFLKTNWHCPRDAIWITAGQTLRVRDLSDVYQLLKASLICKEDLSAIDRENFSHIVFKKWKEVHPGTEFRCFVRGRNLIAISPRDFPQYHSHFNEQKKDIIKDIVSLFKEKIKDSFPIDNYCFDVIRETKDHVTLVDFSPFREKYTAALAFDWKYLKSDDIIMNNEDESECDNPEFRFLADEISIQPNPRNNYGFPQDIIEMFKASNISPNIESFHRLREGDYDSDEE